MLSVGKLLQYPSRSDFPNSQVRLEKERSEARRRSRRRSRAPRRSKRKGRVKKRGRKEISFHHQSPQEEVEGMAESIVRSSIGLLCKLLVEQGIRLCGVEESVKHLRDELVWMQCFVRNADAIRYDNEIVGLWVLQIKENVMTGEEIIENFVVNVMDRRRGTSWLKKLKRCLFILMELIARHRVASRIDSFKFNISMLTDRMHKYGLQTEFLKEGQSQEALSWQAFLRRNHLYDEDHYIVGLQEDIEKLEKELLKPAPGPPKVVNIHGPEGCGKTTLARKVYHRKGIRKHFHHLSWACVSSTSQPGVIVRQILHDFNLERPVENDPSEGTRGQLHDLLYQRQNILVVLDNVRDEKALKDVEDVIEDPTLLRPWCDIKVLITTSNPRVAKDPSQYALFSQLGLSDQKRDDVLTKILEHDERDQLNANGDLKKELKKHCDGFPAAVYVLGGILMRKRELVEWEGVVKDLARIEKQGTPAGMSVLLLGYKDLPYFIKSCFLYLANFPADDEISTDKLYRMWVAEGLVSWPDGVSATKSLEDVANDYLIYLVQAGFVAAVEVGVNNRILSIRINNYVRRLCFQAAAAENFLFVVDHRPSQDIPVIFSSSNYHNRLLRMAIYLAHGVKSFFPDSLTSEDHEYLRSLLLFCTHEVDDKANYKSWMKQICKGFRRLRVLDIEGFRIEGMLTRQIKKLIHLRYLSLKGTKVDKLPSSIGKLRFLEMLDVRVSSSVKLVKIPNTLQKLDMLRHLFLPSVDYDTYRSKKLFLGTLSCLETLENLELNKFRLQDLLRLGKLRKLTVKDSISSMENLMFILESPAVKLGNLQSCSLVIEGTVIVGDPSLLSSYDFLHELKIVDKRPVHIRDIAFPKGLQVLHLDSGRLEDDPSPILGKLSFLQELFLGKHSFVGSKMDFPTESFLALKTLNFEGLENFEVWEVHEGCLPDLEKLVIKNCDRLRTIPEILPASLRC